VDDPAYFSALSFSFSFSAVIAFSTGNCGGFSPGLNSGSSIGDAR
jgi:hypothetical protein